MRAKYVDLFTDFGFKKLFGEEVSKPLLIEQITALFEVSVEFVQRCQSQSQ